MSSVQDDDSDPEKLPLVKKGAGDVETFVAAIRHLSLARSVDEIMAVATSAARHLLDADGITFVLREGECCHYADEDAIAPLWKGKRFPLDACISGWCMTRGQPAAIPDIYADDRIPHDAYRPTFVRSLAMVPVRKEDPIAALGAYWAEIKEVSSEDLELLQTMADAAALAIANITLQCEKEAAALVREESFHRIKNIFSVVISLAFQIDSESVEAYRDALVARLRALEGAHSNIFEADGQSVDIHNLLQAVLSGYAPQGNFQLRCETDEVFFSGSSAADLALIVNELAMNAVEHGAWSSRTGRVEILCEHVGGQFLLKWQERGGPPASPPTRDGFGMRLIRAIANQKLDGRLELDWAPSGLTCELRISDSKEAR